METILEIYFRIFYLIKKIIIQSKQSSKVQLSGNNLKHLGGELSMFNKYTCFNFQMETVLKIYFRIFYLIKIIIQSKQSSKAQLSGNNLEHLAEISMFKYTSIRVSTY